MTDWTTARVKKELPQVKVVFHNTISRPVLLADLRGRSMPFAKVYPSRTVGAGYEVAWSTVVDCLNGDRPIIL